MSCRLTQTEPSGHPNAYGLIFGGSDLAGANQLIVFRHRAAWGVPHQEADGRRHANGGRLDRARRDQRSRWPGALGERARGGGRELPGPFPVNGTEVATQPRSAVDTDGITGLRVTHLLDVHVGDLQLGM